ncbi:MAG: cell division protein FtsA [Chloroflexota bacterium]
MAKAVQYAAIDVGTTKVCTLVGQINASGGVEVVGVGVVPSRGLQKGMVVNIDEATDAIRASIQRATHSSGGQIRHAYLGITGSHLTSVNNRGTVTMVRPDRLVAGDDVSRVMEAARTTVGVPNNREVIHVLPRGYTLDGQEGIRNPIGLHGFRLDVDAHIIMGALTSIQNLTKCVEQLGVTVDDLVLEPLASGEAVLTDDERENGTLLVDIGGGTTDIAVFQQGSVAHTSIIPIGGHQFTQDLVIGLRAPYAAAEAAKIAHGTVEPDGVGGDEMVELSAFGETAKRPVSRRLMADILRARFDELVELVQAEVRKAGYLGLLPAGAVLTGGSSGLGHLTEVAEHLFNMPARIGRPSGVSGLTDSISAPAFATSVGLLLWAARFGDLEAPGQSGFSLTEWIQNLLALLRGRN